ncbi:MAG TPA: arylesterase [Stellaceae bacterium]|nr:arylesterase [Stellaceae bacterium]
MLVNCIVVAMVVISLSSSASAEPARILALGDSITAGYGLAPQEALPVKLEARLAADGFDAQVINAGVSGDTTAGGLSRLAWALGDKPLPGYAMVELGANDMLRGLDPKEAEANLDQILSRLTDAGVKTLLVGMRAPGNWGRDYQEAFDAIYPKLADKYRVPLYPFLLDGVALDPKLNQGDGLHPNADGVMVIVGRLAPMVESLLQGAHSKAVNKD